jgi:hypothetical protein
MGIVDQIIKKNRVVHQKNSGDLKFFGNQVWELKANNRNVLVCNMLLESF